jgi:enhancing lycopene biosynthesis protein 2
MQEDLTYLSSIPEQFDLASANEDAVDAFLAPAGILGGFQDACQLTSYCFELSRVEVNSTMKHAIEKSSKSNRPAWTGVWFGSLYGEASIEF